MGEAPGGEHVYESHSRESVCGEAGVAGPVCVGGQMSHDRETAKSSPLGQDEEANLDEGMMNSIPKE